MNNLLNGDHVILPKGVDLVSKTRIETTEYLENVKSNDNIKGYDIKS